MNALRQRLDPRIYGKIGRQRLGPQSGRGERLCAAGPGVVGGHDQALPEPVGCPKVAPHVCGRSGLSRRRRGRLELDADVRAAVTGAATRGQPAHGPSEGPPVARVPDRLRSGSELGDITGGLGP